MLLTTTATQQQFLKTNNQARISSRVLISPFSYVYPLGAIPEQRESRGVTESASSPQTCSISYFLSLLDLRVTRWVSRSRCENKVFSQDTSLWDNGSEVRLRQRVVWLQESPAKLWPRAKCCLSPACCRYEWPLKTRMARPVYVACWVATRFRLLQEGHSLKSSSAAVVSAERINNVNVTVSMRGHVLPNIHKLGLKSCHKSPKGQQSAILLPFRPHSLLMTFSTLPP